jgi:predicted regulator of Ras-like GTPase activity (Roadblock/LC7/MglB family)
MKQKRVMKAKRDTSPSEFALILRRVCDAVSSVEMAAFVDMEGECIDYYSSLDPYEAKLVAAQTVSLLGQVLELNRKLRFGESYILEISTGEKELLARRINDDYLLVVLALPEEENSRISRVLVHAAREFRTDAGVAAASWEPSADILMVDTRGAKGWKYAPSAFSEDGKRVVISDVLGRWIESGELRSRGKVCFRVRTEQGMELTLVHDPDLNQWTSRL